MVRPKEFVRRLKARHKLNSEKGLRKADLSKKKYSQRCPIGRNTIVVNNTIDFA